VIIENNNTTIKNCHNSKDLFNNGYFKNYNLKNPTFYKSSNNNDILDKKAKKKI
jgi:hypothetical protein